MSSGALLRREAYSAMAYQDDPSRGRAADPYGYQGRYRREFWLCQYRSANYACLRRFGQTLALRDWGIARTRVDQGASGRMTEKNGQDRTWDPSALRV